MRNSMFILAMLLVGCVGGDGGGAPPAVVRHAPVISGLKLSPDNVAYMAGGGEAAVSVELTFADSGKDIQALWVGMPDGTRRELSAASGTIAGIVSEKIALSTSAVGRFTVEVWLIDRAGDSSNHLTARFVVLGDVTPTTWTKRLSGVPFALNDVVYNGTTFVAVGDGGAVLTSADGIDWVPGDSGTAVDLTSVASMGADIVAVGNDATVLLSNDGGASWSRKFSKERVRLAGVAASSSQIIAGGMDLMTGNVFIVRSRDGGASWTGVESWPRYDHFVTDIVYADGIFVAATYAYNNDPTSVAYAMVSTDGAYWNAVAVSEKVEALGAVAHHGNQFIAAGPDGTMFASADAYNWTALQTPVDRVEYSSFAWNGSRLVVAGGMPYWFWWLGTPSFQRPVGLTSTDGGATWEIFNIDGYYRSNGMAWGDGRFVSVGQSTPVSGEGAIYTWD